MSRPKDILSRLLLERTTSIENLLLICLFVKTKQVPTMVPTKSSMKFEYINE